MGEFAVSIEHSEAKSVSALGGGGFAPDPRYRLALRALAMSPLCQILNRPTPLGVGVLKISLDLSGCRE